MHTHILILVHTSTVSAASTEISAFSFTDTSTAFYFSTDNSTSTLAEISIAKIDYSETVISPVWQHWNIWSVSDSSATFSTTFSVYMFKYTLTIPLPTGLKLEIKVAHSDCTTTDFYFAQLLDSKRRFKPFRWFNFNWHFTCFKWSSKTCKRKICILRHFNQFTVFAPAIYSVHKHTNIFSRKCTLFKIL